MAEQSGPNSSGLPTGLAQRMTPEQLATYRQSQRRVDQTQQSSVTKGIGPERKPPAEPSQG
jgi:hypothetical protein